jgi:hypothetical protein
MPGSGLNSLMVHKHEMLYFGFVLFNAFTIDNRGQICIYLYTFSKITKYFKYCILYLF